MLKPWRMVEVVITCTTALPEVGPWQPLGPMAGRGQPGPPAWGWREASGAFHWEDGGPPMVLGLLCDVEWRPIPAADLHLFVVPPCGWSRSQVARQKRDARDVAVP